MVLVCILFAFLTLAIFRFAAETFETAFPEVDETFFAVSETALVAVFFGHDVVVGELDFTDSFPDPEAVPVPDPELLPELEEESVLSFLPHCCMVRVTFAFTHFLLCDISMFFTVADVSIRRQLTSFFPPM